MTQEMALYQEPAPLSPAEVRKQINLIQEIMKDAMKEGEHYGKIPGCGDKPALLKAGAEKLNLTFRMAPEFEVERIDLPGGHREYIVKCRLFSIASHNLLGEGVGSCSSMEAKYRYRPGPAEFTGQPVPKAYWSGRDQAMLGGKGFVAKKNPDTGQWEIATQGEKVENDNPADTFNTILKMAKKRAHVDAVLTVTAASDIFTQDIEELVDTGIIDVKATEIKATQKPQEGQSPLGQGDGKGSDQKPPTSGDIASEAQLALIAAKLQRAEIDRKDLKQFLKVSSLKNLPKSRVNEALGWIEATSRGEVYEPGKNQDIPY